MRAYYPYYRYQEGGERKIPGPVGEVPVLPVVTDPREFARLYGTGSAGSDVGYSAGVPVRSQTEALIQQALAAQAAQRRAVEEQKMRGRISHEAVPRLANPKTSDVRGREAGVAGDIGEQNFVPQMGALVGQWEGEQDQLQAGLLRLGYPVAHAAALARTGRWQLHPSLQQQLDDLAKNDYRVRNHPDFNPQLAVEEQQYLNQDNSLKTRLLRGRNMLVHTNNPVADFVTDAVTYPGKAFTNLTMDAENQYVKPGLAQGALNFGNDVMSLVPGVGEQAVGSLVNRASPRALSYMANPAVQGADDLGRWYFNKAASSPRLKEALPLHNYFASQVNGLLEKGIPMKDAIQSSYLNVTGDNLLGMDLTSSTLGPKDVYKQIMTQQEALPVGKRWQNEVFSTDSYPLILDYVNKRLDKQKYRIVPTYSYSNMNNWGYKSNDVLESLAESEKSLYKNALNAIEKRKQKVRELERKVGQDRSPEELEMLNKAYEESKDRFNDLDLLMSNKVNGLINTDENFRNSLAQKFNDRIKQTNKIHGVYMPQAQVLANNIRLPQFLIERKNTNPLLRLREFAGRTGFISDRTDIPQVSNDLIDRLSKLTAAEREALLYDLPWMNDNYWIAKPPNLTSNEMQQQLHFGVPNLSANINKQLSALNFIDVGKLKNLSTRDVDQLLHTPRKR